jgi:cytochrome c
VKRIERVAVVVVFALFGMAFASLLLSSQMSFVHAQDHSGDGPPIVKITTPRNNSVYSWNTQVSYGIVVSDHGKSTKYQEIPANHVLLKTSYISDLSHADADLAQAKRPDPEGLLDIMNSNCLGCHGLKSAATGPSFSAISKRYPDTAATEETLSQHIKQGSVGIWGQEPMPSHPELTAKELQAISGWIMKHSADPKVNYYVGTDGAFQMESPGKPDPKAGMILTASYVSQSASNSAHQALRGEDTIVVGGK